MAHGVISIQSYSIKFGARLLGPGPTGISSKLDHEFYRCGSELLDGF